MSTLARLVRVSLRVNFSLSLLRPKYLLRKKHDLWMIPMIGLGGLGIGVMLVLYIKLIRLAYNALAPSGQASVLLTFAVLLGQVFILILGFYYVISAFYFSRDLEILIPLPLTPTQVMLSKFAVILANEYITVSFFVLPVFVVYGVMERAGPAYWIAAALGYLLLPVIPLAVAAILIVILMRFVNLGRKKDALIIVGSLVLMIGALGLQYWIGRSTGSSSEPEAIARILASSDGLIRSLGAKFPPSIWITKALAYGLRGTGPANALLFLGVSAGLFLGLLVAAKKLFYHGLIGLGETPARKKTLSREAMAARMSSGRHPVRAIFLRELRIMNRTPIFLLNGVLSVILIPVIFVLMAKMGGGQSSDVSRLIAGLGSANPTMAVFAAALFMAVSGCLNGTSSSTFSREGGQFWLSKVIPVAPRDQVKGKLLHSLAVAGLGIVAGLAVIVFALRVAVPILAVALALGVLASFALTVLGMMIDLARPLLDWTNPQKAIKQNLNVLFSVFADLGIFVLLFVFVKLARAAGLSNGLVVAAVAGLLAIAGVLGYRLLLVFADRRYPQIEP
jgi:ABC-2 type transport system permease protein